MGGAGAHAIAPSGRTCTATGAVRANGRIGNSKHGAHLYSRDPFALRSVRPATADTDATFVSRTVAELRRSPAPNHRGIHPGCWHERRSELSRALATYPTHGLSILGAAGVLARAFNPRGANLSPPLPLGLLHALR